MADILTLKKFEALSPFEIKDELINLAKSTSKRTQTAFLNAGRGNPNWVATTPREGFFLLGQFAITESRRVMEHPAGLGGMPQPQGIASRLEAWLAQASRPARCLLSFGNGSVCREDVWLRGGRLRPRTRRFNHWRQLPGSRPHARTQ